MTRLITSGAEVFTSSATLTTDPDGQANGSFFPDRETTIKRSGNASFRCIGSVTNTSFMLFTYITNDQHALARAYFRVQLPSSETPIMRIRGPAANQLAECRLNPDGTIELWVYTGGAMTQQGSASAKALDNNVSFYMIQMRLKQSTTAGADEAELILDGETVAIWTGTLTETSNPTQLLVGWCTAPGNSVNCYIDDVALNDSSGSNQNTWPGEGKVVLLKPISDSQDGSWTGGAGGTGIDLSLAVTSTPPVGTATETDTTQIESADGTGNNATDEYRANLTTYSSAGITAADVIKCLFGWICHGEDVTTNTKTGSFGGQANPSWAYENFTYGNDGGALGTWPTGWNWFRSIIQYLPVVTLGSSLVLAVRKTDTGTRVASVCFMGVYCEYEVGATEAETQERIQMLRGMAHPEPHYNDWR